MVLRLVFIRQLFGALTMTNDSNQTAAAFSSADFKTTTGKASNTNIISFAAQESTEVWDLDAVSMGVFQKALENISFLRAQVGGQMSRLVLPQIHYLFSRPISVLHLDGLRMWISRRRVQTYPSTAF